MDPAIVGSGRCTAQIEAGSLSASEACEWLGDQVPHRGGGATLAELLSLRKEKRKRTRSGDTIHLLTP